MENNPYERFRESQLILRDELAIDRTALANERTLLSYLRAGITLLLAGVTLLNFFHSGYLFYVSLICLPLGLATTILGVVRFRKMAASIDVVRHSISESKEPD
jgi:putative membrane protein